MKLKLLKWEITKSNCWKVISHKPQPSGYIPIMRNGIMYKAHRLIWMKIYGLIPKGLCICHSCDTPACVNPGHLFLGTQKDNMQDMIKKKRNNPNKGENNGQSKLKNHEVIQIKKLLKEGKYPQYAIANKFNISESNISYIKNKIWSYI